MDSVDKKILNIIQTAFPVAPRPYEDIGAQIGVSEQEAFDRVTKLYEEKVIRRIGASYDSKQLHFTSTLCSLKAPEDKIEEVAKIISEYPEVTHNYQRNHEYNVWFTIIAESQERIEQILSEISQKSGLNGIRNMPASIKFKIKVDFNFKDKS